MLARLGRLMVCGLAMAVVAVAIVAGPQRALAMGTETPADPCEKFKKGSKDWKDCRRKAGLPTEARPEVDDAATLGYALTKAGRQTEALAVLRPHAASGDARILTYIGFAERKLGRIEIALEYYRRSLAIAPDNVATLEYFGEALLERGDVTAADAALRRIEGICGRTCEAYKLLSGAIGGRVTGKG